MKIDENRLKSYTKRIKPTSCPLCGNNHWTFSDTIFQLTEFDTKGIIVGGAVFPVIPLTCNNCGNTYFINVLSAKLIDKPDFKEEVNQNGKNE